MLTNPLSDRNIGSFPVSIGTSNALEALFTPEHSIHKDKTISPLPPGVKPSCLLVNVRTLARNMISSVGSPIARTLNSSDLYYTLQSEIDVIKNLCAFKQWSVIFYWPLYDNLFKANNKYRSFRIPNTDIQKHQDSLYRGLNKIIKKNSDVKIIDHSLNGLINNQYMSTALIITHIPYDLLNYKHFKRLILIESMTGKIKYRDQWGSKYHPIGNKSLEQLPFTEKLLWIFGDKDGIIKPINIKGTKAGLGFRQVVYDIAQKSKWRPTTTIDKIKFDLQRLINEPFLLTVFGEL